jgi:iron complex outermembrane receptor protein
MKPFLSLLFLLFPWLFTSAQETTSSSAFPRPGGTTLSPIVVTASPLGRTSFDLAEPVNVLTGQELKQRSAPSLGETLSNEPGLASSYFTVGASRPIIRGLADNRVLVLNNGTDIFDVSNISPDHAPTVTPLLAQSIEVVRGPATVLYGSSAIGGVVNVIDNRIATNTPLAPLTGELAGRFDSTTLERSVAGSIDFALTKHLIFHLDGAMTRTDNLHIPGYALSERIRRELSPTQQARGSQFGGDPLHIVPNTFVFNREFGIGASYVWDKGFAGFSFSQFASKYGVPDDPEVDDPIEVPARVTLDLTKRSYNVHAGLRDPFPCFSSADLKFSYVDYIHRELDDGVTGATFRTNGFDSRLEFVHQPIGRFEGSVGVQAQYRNFSVTGEEAFLQPTHTLQLAAFAFEELRFAWLPLRLQAGARIEYNAVDINSTDPELTSLQPGQSTNRNFLPISVAAGAIYDFTQDMNAAFTVRFSERAPTAEELYAHGPHDATFQFLLGDPNLSTEQVLGVDLSIRKRAGFITGSISGFYNHFFNFIDFTPTGEVEDDLTVFEYAGKRADFLGGEALVQFHFLPSKIRPNSAEVSDVKQIVTGEKRQEIDNPNDLYLELRTDYVYAQNNTDNEPLPRIPPWRYGGAVGYHSPQWDARFEVTRVEGQDRIAQFETTTPGYTMMNASLSYTFSIRESNWNIYVKGTNLLDEEARVHTSFLKEVLPLGGRGIVTGLNVAF